LQFDAAMPDNSSLVADRVGDVVEQSDDDDDVDGLQLSQPSSLQIRSHGDQDEDEFMSYDASDVVDDSCSANNSLGMHSRLDCVDM